ncbi:FG-GAP-like repeat-containing protein [Mitsuaria sp. GD03876]|uniref:FG-GAP-like repeat-containing protein n=1 Tax=Mitsuaria sp. GD03876 TaxID=2975399 RepID=UPI0024497258|nr:FG-GAP-like repeat-containing protein [Mitsuaria sp. GD03876]MDH0868220.1 FG-GAP-like repeat-containing protein [Mitsuaria sp. GD03876]
MKVNALNLKVLGSLVLATLPAWSGAAVTVSPSGQPGYSIKVQTPPGRGPEPSISINYSGARNGAVGTGWTLSVGAQITRCAGIKAIDGMPGTVNFDATDKLCLNGARLIALDGEGNPTVGLTTRDAAGLDTSSYREYRIETDSRTRVRAYGMAGTDANSGPKYFKVWHPDGGESVIGKATDEATNNAVILGTQSRYAKTAMTWLVAQTRDQHGNGIQFFYDQAEYRVGANVDDPSGYASLGKDVVVKEIQYGPGNKVVFSYSDRADTLGAREETLYRGNKSVSVRLLNAISTYVNAPAGIGQLDGAVHVRTLRLSYDTGTVSGRPRLKDVKACTAVTAGKCLPSTSFTYTEGGPSSFSKVTALDLPADLYTPIHLDPNLTATYSADFDGDGRTDLLSASGDRSPRTLIYRSKGGGAFESIADPVLANERLVSFSVPTANWWATCSITVLVRDFNGDGRPDILRTAGGPPDMTPQTEPCQATKTALFLNTPTGFVKKEAPGLPASGGSNWFPDFIYDGDGNPGAFQGWGAATSSYWIDLNGDGILDLLVTSIGEKDYASSSFVLCPSGKCTRAYLGDGQGGFSEIPTNLAPFPLVFLASVGAGGGPVVDINGDGLADLLVADPRSRIYSQSPGTEPWWDVMTSRGDGNFDFKANFGLSEILSASALDVQGDGQPEIRATMSELNGSFERVWHLPDPAFSVMGGYPWKGLPVLDQDTPIVGGGYSVPIDFNGDGRTDSLFIVPKVDSTSSYQSYYQVMLLTHKGQDRAFNIPISKLGTMENGSPCCGYKRQLHIGNFTGNSPVEILSLGHARNNEANELYTPDHPIPPDRLLTVREGASGTTTLTYAPAAATDRVVAETAVGEGQIALAPAGIVVTAMSAPSGVPGRPSVTEYAYAGMRSDKNGRGSLGYRVVKAQADTAAGRAATTVTRFAQTFPYVGMPMSTSTVLSSIGSTGSGQVLSTKDYAYCDAGNDVATRDALVAGNGNCAAIASPIKRTYTRLVSASGKELDGSALPQQTVTTDVNAAGYPTKTQTATTFEGRSYGSAESITYVADDVSCSAKDSCRWWVSRPDRTVVSKTVPKVLLETTAPNGGNPTTPPDPPSTVPPAVLAAILQLLQDE